MRADRLVSLVLLLRQRGRLTADAIAEELEVSKRTVLRDIDALSAAGVPVFAERGRLGGYELLPGFRTELTGLNNDEAVALLTAGNPALGLGSALASAMRKVVDALPHSQQATVDDVTRRLLHQPATGFLPLRTTPETASDAVMVEVRRAVLEGRKLRILYGSHGEPKWRTIDPIGLVTARDRIYLLATVGGADRTYRASRILDAQTLPEPAERRASVDLDQLWRERCEQFLAEGHIEVEVVVDAARRDDLVVMAVGLRAETEAENRVRLDLMFQDPWHAEWALWQMGTAAEVLSPESLRSGLRDRALAVAGLYASQGEVRL